MMRNLFQYAARPLRAVSILGLVLFLAAEAHAATPAPANPKWRELTPAQQQTLEPLAGEWDELDSSRKNKWLAIGNKYATMKPEDQQRLQERMREWVRLTPEQRRVARESYSRAKKLDPDRKSAQWEKYQQLPEEQKQKLANAAASKKPPVAALPPATQANKTIAPIKSSPNKPVLEQSVTPKAAAAQSALQPSASTTK